MFITTSGAAKAVAITLDPEDDSEAIVDGNG
jgi:hypothetical protein